MQIFDSVGENLLQCALGERTLFGTVRITWLNSVRLCVALQLRFISVLPVV